MKPPLMIVWEITLACNLRCRHCGSLAGNTRVKELSTEEALDLVRQMAEMKIPFVTLLGGEPLLRKDWKQMVKALSNLGSIYGSMQGIAGPSMPMIENLEIDRIPERSSNGDGSTLEDYEG